MRPPIEDWMDEGDEKDFVSIDLKAYKGIALLNGATGMDTAVLALVPFEINSAVAAHTAARRRMT